MSDLIIPGQQPKCMQGCAYYRVIKGLSGASYPKCILAMMVTYIDKGVLVVDVKECPEFTTPEELKKQMTIKPEQHEGK